MTASPKPCKYFAFISYSRKESRIAAWLQKRLEWFRFPVKLVPEGRRPPHDRYVRPIYRDKTNLEVTDEHYWTNIRSALEESRYLIVLCSPNSAKSEPVNMEVRHFLQVHGGDTSRVVPVITGGNVVSSGEDASLCPALRELGDQLINRNLPTLIPDADTGERDAWESGFVALSSYLLQLERTAIGDHIQRESRRQARSLRLWLGAVTALAALAIFAGWMVVRQLAETQRQLEHAWLEEGRAWLERARVAKGEKDHLKALLLAGRAVGYVDFGRKEAETPEIEKTYPPLLGRPFKDPEAERQRKDEVRAVHEFVGLVSPSSVPIWSSPIRPHHQGEVATVVFSPNGRLLASASHDHTVKLWDAVTGKEVATLSGHSERVNSVAFSPDGLRVISGSNDKTIRFWDASTGRELAICQGHSKGVHSVAFCPNGHRVASSADDHTVRLWDSTSGRELATMRGHLQGVASVAFSPDGAHLASGSNDGTIQLWDTTNGHEAGVLKGHSGGVACVVFSPDGLRLASGSDDHTIKLWNVASGKVEATLQGHSSTVAGVAFSSDGKRLASGASDWNRPGEIKLWDAQNGAELATLDGNSRWVQSVAFNPEGSRLASGSQTGIIALWDVATGRHLVVPEGHSDLVTNVAFNPDGTRVAAATWDGTVKVWDVVAGKEAFTLHGHSETVKSVAFSLDGTRLASGAADNTIKLWDAKTGRELTSLQGHSGEVTSVAFSPDGTRVASGSDDLTVRLWNVANGKELASCSGHSQGVTSVAFHPNGTCVASGSKDQTVVVWDATSGKKMDDIRGHSGAVWALAFSPDGTLIASGSEDKTVRLSDASYYCDKSRIVGLAASSRTDALLASHNTSSTPSGRGRFVAAMRMPGETVILKGHASGVTGLAFGAGGSRLVSRAADGIRLWEEASAREIVHLPGGAGGSGLAFSPDGMRMAAGSEWAVQMWDVAALTELTCFNWEGNYWSPAKRESLSRLFHHSCSITSVALSPDFTLAVSGSEDKTVSIWDAATSAKLASLRGHDAAVTCVAFSATGDRIASGASDSTVRIWDALTGMELAALHGGSGKISSVAFSPDGSQVVSATEEEKVMLWDAVTGKEMTTLNKHTGTGIKVVQIAPVMAAFSPDGSRLATASRDVTLWDVKTGQMLATFEGYSSHPVRVAFSPDGSCFACEWKDRTVKLWDVVTGRELSDKPDFLLVGNTFSGHQGGNYHARALDSRVVIESADIIRPDLMNLMRQDLFQLEGRKIEWPRVSSSLFSSLAFTPVFHRQDELAQLASPQLPGPKRDQLILQLLAKGAQWRAAIRHWDSIQNPDAATRQAYLTLLLCQALEEAGREDSTALETLLPGITTAMTAETVQDSRVCLPLVSLLSRTQTEGDSRLTDLLDKVRPYAPSGLMEAIKKQNSQN